MLEESIGKVAEKNESTLLHGGKVADTVPTSTERSGPERRPTNRKDRQMNDTNGTRYETYAGRCADVTIHRASPNAPRTYKVVVLDTNERATFEGRWGRVSLKNFLRERLGDDWCYITISFDELEREAQEALDNHVE